MARNNGYCKTAAKGGVVIPINRKHFIALVEDVLHKVPGYYSTTAMVLMEYTAVVESDRGEYLTQIGGGPGLGVMGVEPETMADIYGRYLTRISNRGLYKSIMEACCMNTPCPDALRYNMAFCILTARTKYWMSPKPIPTNLAGIADYHESIYNGAKLNYKATGETDQSIGISKYIASSIG